MPTSIPAPAPGVQEYLDAANAVYTRVTSSPDNGLITPLLTSSGGDAFGFYATAFQDGFGNVIIAYEGSTPGFGDIYSLASTADDGLILEGLTPYCFDLAVTFAQQVQQAYGSSPIYVTGHSLGGAEADHVAATLGPNIIKGGDTFGAPGLPGYNGPTGQGNITDYIDNGDPVGNFALEVEAFFIISPECRVATLVPLHRWVCLRR